MIKIIDTTLTAMDNHLPSKEDLHYFCYLLNEIGVDYIEISTKVYDKMEYLPEGMHFFLRLKVQKDKPKYPGCYRYVIHHGENDINVIAKVQINDIREIIKLRSMSNQEEVCIVGLDDLICHNYNEIMEEMKRILPNSKITFCPENTYDLASALAVQWILNGGNQVMTSFAGYGNKAATEEVLLALRIAIRHKPNQQLNQLPELTKLYSKVTGEIISKNKPIIGENIFKVEAGIHADGIIKNPTNYEPFEPEIVGGNRTIIIGKHSGKRAIQLKCLQHGIILPNDRMLKEIIEKVESVCVNERNSLSDQEFVALVKEVYGYENKKKYC